VLKHWPGRTIRDYDDTWFTLMTLNTNPLHFDDHFAAQSPHGRCLVNGTLVFALTVGLSVRDVSEAAIAKLEYEKILHLAPTYHGDTIYAESEILEVTPSASKPDRGIVYLETRARNQDGTVVLTLRRRVMVPRRPTT
jgi:acyl dehydratase